MPVWSAPLRTVTVPCGSIRATGAFSRVHWSIPNLHSTYPHGNWPPPVRHLRSAVLDYNADGLVDLLENWRGQDTYGGLRETVEHHQSLAMFFNRAIRDGSVPDPEFVEFLSPNVNRDIGFLKVADVDGDGNTDLFGENNGVFYGSGMKNRMLSRVVDGLGNVTAITYDEFGAYKRNPTDIALPPCEATWPEICLPKVTGLVSRHQDGFLDGTNQTQIRTTTAYRYFNARVNVTGHGFLGFDRRVVAESSTPGASQESQQTVQTVTIDAQPIVRVRPNGQLADDTKPPYLYPAHVREPRRPAHQLHVRTLRTRREPRPARAHRPHHRRRELSRGHRLRRSGSHPERALPGLRDQSGSSIPHSACRMDRST